MFYKLLPEANVNRIHHLSLFNKSPSAPIRIATPPEQKVRWFIVNQLLMMRAKLDAYT